MLLGGHQTIEGITTYALGDLTIREPEYGSGARAVEMASPDEVKYIRITDFDDYGIPPGHEFVTASVVESKYALKQEDLLFARSGATAGKTFLYNDDLEPAIFAGYCIRFQFDPDRVIPEFVYFYTKSTRYMAWVDSIQRPAGQPNINKEEFKSFTIPLPTLDKQQKLVAEMKAAQEARRKKLAQAEELLDGFDDYLLDRLGLVAAAGQDQAAFATRLSSVLLSKRINPQYFHPERMSAIQAIQNASTNLKPRVLNTMADFKRDIVPAGASDNYIGLANVQSNTGELVETTDRPSGTCFRFSENDVLFARLRPYLNKVHRAERSGVCSTEFHVIRLRQAESKNEVLPGYLSSVLRSSIILAQVKHMMTGNTLPRLANDDVVNLVIPMPEISVQREIVAEMRRRRKESRKLRTGAQAVWEAAKAGFERKLLGEESGL